MSNSIKENSVVYFKKDKDKFPFLVHEVVGNMVSLGLENYPDIEQDHYTPIEQISLFDDDEVVFAERLIKKLID
jgi:hypothetical protein